ncbi:hypothetical protein Tco_0559490 [Tanacetum coccineum]
MGSFGTGGVELQTGGTLGYWYPGRGGLQALSEICYIFLTGVAWIDSSGHAVLALIEFFGLLCGVFLLTRPRLGQELGEARLVRDAGFRGWKGLKFLNIEGLGNGQ